MKYSVVKKIGNNKYMCSNIQEIILVSEKEDDNLECSWKGIDDSVIKRTVIPKKLLMLPFVTKVVGWGKVCLGIRDLFVIHMKFFLGIQHN